LRVACCVLHDPACFLFSGSAEVSLERGNTLHGIEAKVNKKKKKKKKKGKGKGKMNSTED
jgi:hypothetical protein